MRNETVDAAEVLRLGLSPCYGCPSQDLSHFCSSLTTLWKTR